MSDIISKFFYLNKNTNNIKVKSLYVKAFQLMLYKNYISELIYNEILITGNLKEFTKFDLIKKETKQEIKFINNKDMEYGIKQVYSNYINKIKVLQKKNKFIKPIMKIQYYKKTIKSKNGLILHKIGDYRNTKTTYTKTPLNTICNYMLNNYTETYEDWIEKTKYMLNENNFSNDKSNKNYIKPEVITFFKQIDFYLNKFGKRLIKLIMLKKRNLNTKYWKQKINIKSLSFKTQSRIQQNILNINDNNKSIIDGFIILGGYDYYDKTIKIKNKLKSKKGELVLPIKLHSNYHFNTNKPLNKIKNEEWYVKSYNVTFNQFNELKSIDLSSKDNILEDKLNKFDYSNNTNYSGLDVNTKHNLFQLSNGRTYNYNKDIMNEYLQFIKNYDNKINKKNDTKRKILKRKKLQNKLNYNILNVISKMLKDLKKDNINHLVLEDLNLTNTSLRSKNKEYDIGYGRLFSFINITTLKDSIRSMAHKNGISVSFVPSEYTSQQCNKCKYISKLNRKTQENFKCIKCDNIENSDYNSSLNIRDILLSDVLIKEFLSFDKEYCEYSVKSFLSHKDIKEIYLKQGQKRMV